MSSKYKLLIFMKKLLNTIILFSLFSFVSIVSHAQGYKIIGKVTGFADSTKLYLADVTDGSFKPIDSTYVINGNFTFEGKLNHKAVQTYIHTKNFADRVSLWLQNTSVNFAATKGKFKEAIIDGSETQNQMAALNKATVGLSDEKAKEQYILFIKNNPESIISAYLLSLFATTWGRETVQDLSTLLSAESKTTYYGKNIETFLVLSKDIKIGEPFADISQPDTSGINRKLSDLKGKVILLDFWGSWCGPCREANPKLVKIYDKFKAKGFDIFGVGAETQKKQWVAALKKDGLQWINVSDLKGDKNEAALMYNVGQYPTNFLIDKNGIIIAKDISIEELSKKLTELL